MEVLTLNHLWEKIGSVFSTKAQLSAGLGSKQGTLVSGQSIKTINNESILGSGNITIQGGGSVYVPTLNAAPTSSTTSYTKDGQTVDFEIGQFARVAKQGGEYDFYQLYDLQTVSNVTTATWEKTENIHADHEDVYIAVTVDSGAPSGTTAAGLVINVYYNDASVPTTTVTTDSNGMASVSVPNGYKYRLVFPTQQGCRGIADVVHTASVSQRSVEVEYQAGGVAGDSEHVIVQLLSKTMDSYSVVAGETVTLTYDGQSQTATTDSGGKASFDVPYGKQYVVTSPTRSGYYITNNAYTKTFTAAESSRAMDFIYKTYNSGLFIVPADGTEYRLDEWEAAVDGGTRQNSEALYIKVATSTLASKGGTFCVEIDTIRERSYGATKAWCTSNVEFKSIPLNGNSSSASYYYDGLTASRLIKAEAVEKGLSVPAFDVALGETRSIGSETAAGFIGSVGQWSQLWGNRSEIDDILLSVRPNGTYLLSTLTTNKWTCTQSNASNAYYWGTAANNNNKTISYVVLPFFAY